MKSFWKGSAKDKIQNGTILGGLFGAAIAWGDKLSEFIAQKIVIPADWMYLGDWSMPIYLIGIGALVGYLIDKY